MPSNEFFFGNGTPKYNLPLKSNECSVTVSLKEYMERQGLLENKKKQERAANVAS